MIKNQNVLPNTHLCPLKTSHVLSGLTTDHRPLSSRAKRMGFFQQSWALPHWRSPLFQYMWVRPCRKGSSDVNELLHVLHSFKTTNWCTCYELGHSSDGGGCLLYLCGAGSLQGCSQCASKLFASESPEWLWKHSFSASTADRLKSNISE